MLLENQIVKDIKFANLSYGTPEVYLGDIKLTRPQSAIYNYANAFKSVVFIAGRGAGKSFIARQFLESAVPNGQRVVSCLFSNFVPDYIYNLSKRYKNYKHCNSGNYEKFLRRLDSNCIVHLEEIFLGHSICQEYLPIEGRFFIETTVPTAHFKYGNLSKWFEHLVGRTDTLTVIAGTQTNSANINSNWLQQYSIGLI